MSVETRELDELLEKFELNPDKRRTDISDTVLLWAHKHFIWITHIISIIYIHTGTETTTKNRTDCINYSQIASTDQNVYLSYYTPFPRILALLGKLRDKIISKYTRNYSQWQRDGSRRDKNKRHSVVGFPLQLYPIVCLSIYTADKAFRAAIAHLNLQLALNEWQPRLNRGANATEWCALKSDVISSTPTINYETVKGIRAKVIQLGSHDYIVNDLIAYQLFIFSSLVAITYMDYLINANMMHRVNGLRFSLNPQGERACVRRELNTIVDNVFNTLDNDLELDPKENPPPFEHDYQDEHNHQHYHHHHEPDQSNPATVVPPNGKLVKASSSCECRYKARNDRLLFIRFIRDQRILEQVLPDCLSAGARNTLLAKIWIPILIILIAIMSIDLGAFIYLNIHQALARVEARAQLLKCQHEWHPNATLIRDWQFFLEPLESKADLDLYLALLKGQVSSLRVAIGVELPLIWTYQLLISSLQVVIVFILVSYQLCFQFYILVQGNMSKRLWVSELQQQLKNCFSLLDHFEKLAAIEGTCSASSSQPRLTPIYRVKVERALTIAYLNFELFRRNQRPSLEFQNRFSTQVLGIFFSGLFYGSYILFILGPDKTSVILFLVMLFISITNMYVIVSLYVTLGIEALFKNINVLVAKATKSEMELSYVITLWRRQMTTESQIKRTFTTCVFGLSFTERALITFNTSVLGVWLLLYRSYFAAKMNQAKHQHLNTINNN